MKTVKDETKGVLLIRKEQLEGILDLEKLIYKGIYPHTFLSALPNRARRYGEKKLMKLARKNNYDLVVLSNERESDCGREYFVEPSFYCFK